MVYENKLESPIISLYLFAFIAGAKTYSEVKDYLEELFDKEVKLSNLSKAVSYLVEEKYLIVENDPTSTRFGQTFYLVNKYKVFLDIILTLSKVTSKFTYSFKLDGKNVIKQKNFSYDSLCLDLRSKDKELSNILFKLFSGFCNDVVLFYSGVDFIKRTNKDFNYYNVINDFILGFSVDNEFADDYNKYLSANQFVGVGGEGLDLDSSLKLFRKVCMIYSSLINISDISMMARNRIESNLKK